MLHDLTPPPAHSGDAVALADDQPRKPAFPWPFADRKPSFVPKSIVPHRLPESAEPRTFVAPGRMVDDSPRRPRWIGPFILGTIVLGIGAFFAAAFVRW